MSGKIAIVGPESTGKSALTQKLAGYFQCPHVPEVARDFLVRLGRPYRFEDVETIARLQIEAEEKAMRTNVPLIFCDTNLLVIKIWMQHAWGHYPDWIQKKLETHTYDLTLLCDIDLPWEPDPLREHPHLRQYFSDWYRRELENLMQPWHWVKGSGEERTKLAISIVKNHFQSVLEEYR